MQWCNGSIAIIEKFWLNIKVNISLITLIGRSLILGFEDLLGGGDGDFNDYIISFDVA